MGVFNNHKGMPQIVEYIPDKCYLLNADLKEYKNCPFSTTCNPTKEYCPACKECFAKYALPNMTDADYKRDWLDIDTRLTRTTIVDKLSGLKELIAKANTFYNANTDDWVKLGLASEKELDDYKSGSEAQTKVFRAGRLAEDSIPYPYPAAYYDPRFPKEFTALEIRLTALNVLVEKDKEVSNELSWLAGRTYAGYSILEALNCQEQAKVIQEALRHKAVDTVSAEYYETDHKIDVKTRMGTIAQKVRQQISTEYTAKQKQARAEAEEDALDSDWFGVTVREAVARHDAIDKLVEERKAEKVKPIGEEIRRLLSNVASELKLA